MKQLSHLSVLIVDDNSLSRQTMKMLLDEIGVAQTVSTTDGESALALLTEIDGKVDLVLCDWKMPGLSGFGLLKRVRSSFPELPFIMVTGNASAESVDAARSRGVTDFIAKPFSPQTFRQKLERVALRM